MRWGQPKPAPDTDDNLSVAKEEAWENQAAVMKRQNEELAKANELLKRKAATQTATRLERDRGEMGSSMERMAASTHAARLRGRGALPTHELAAESPPPFHPPPAFGFGPGTYHLLLPC